MAPSPSPHLRDRLLFLHVLEASTEIFKAHDLCPTPLGFRRICDPPGRRGNPESLREIHSRMFVLRSRALPGGPGTAPDPARSPAWAGRPPRGPHASRGENHPIPVSL